MPRRPESRPEEVLVLLVEDDAVVRRKLSKEIKRQGFQIKAVASGQQAIKAIRRNNPHFDILLLNLTMPGMDGHATLNELSSIGLIETLPIIMIGTTDETSALVECIAIGADDYVRAPIDPILLRIRILAAVARYYVEETERERSRRIEREKRLADDLLNVVIPIGVALSAEKDFH